jgi:hypothetical protein
VAVADKPMFCFITSLRARAASAHWGRVCELFERTAESVFAQTDPRFRLIVVGHDRPVLTRAFDARLEFIAADLPIPNGSYAAKEADKRHKLIVGLQRAREVGADYVMSLDADDLVSARLVEYVLSHPDADGWYIQHGYVHRYGSRWVEPMRDSFNLVCGSCNILGRRWFSFPQDAARERAMEKDWFVEGHLQFVRAFAAQGANIRPIPFPAATYIRHDGDRMYRLNPDNVGPKPTRRGPLRRLAGQALLAAVILSRRRPLTGAIRQEFAIAGALAR